MSARSLGPSEWAQPPQPATCSSLRPATVRVQRDAVLLVPNGGTVGGVGRADGPVPVAFATEMFNAQVLRSCSGARRKWGRRWGLSR
jgi:hypothetical protein